MDFLPRPTVCWRLFFSALAVGQLAILPVGAAEPVSAPSPASGLATEGRRKAEHVVIVVWDGLRADSVTEEATPNLARLARGGVTFTRHHSVYPTSTEVNGTAMATGCFPEHSGMLGNRMYLPAINPLDSVATEVPATIRAGDKATGGHYLAAPTLAERIRAAGGRTAITGTKAVTLLHDRSIPRDDTGDLAADSVTLYGGETLPPSASNALATALGEPFPATVNLPNVDQDTWTTRALTEVLWKNGLPKLSLLWLSDPDFTQHRFGPQSPQALRALASSDGNLGKVLAMLDAKGWRDKTDVFVASDHGFSTTANGVNVAEVLTQAGIPVVRAFKTPPKPGEVLAVGLGGTVFFYVIGHDAPTVQRMVDALQGSSFAGAIFTRGGLPGTFPLKAVHIDAPNAPDVVLAMRWNTDKNAQGFPGEMFADAVKKPAAGVHASLSRFEVHNTLIAAGPDFRVGLRNEMPSSNVDLAPTILHILGMPAVPLMDGRILQEALSDSTGVALPPAPVTERLEAVHTVGMTHWSSYLQVTRYGGETYVDEGNAADVVPTPNPSPTNP